MDSLLPVDDNETRETKEGINRDLLWSEQLILKCAMWKPSIYDKSTTLKFSASLNVNNKNISLFYIYFKVMSTWFLGEISFHIINSVNVTIFWNFTDMD